MFSDKEQNNDNFIHSAKVWNTAVADPGGAGRPPPPPLAWPILKSNPRMHQKLPFSGKNSIFFWGGGIAPSPDPSPSTVPPIMKFWIRHWNTAHFLEWKVVSLKCYKHNMAVIEWLLWFRREFGDFLKVCRDI